MIERGGDRTNSWLRIWSLDDRILARAFCTGPKWRRHCGVEERAIAEVNPAAAGYHRPGRKILVYTLEDEIRERILEEIWPGVIAEWTDVRERRK